MLSQSFFSNFGKGPFPQIAGKSPGLIMMVGNGPKEMQWSGQCMILGENTFAYTLSILWAE